MIQYRDGMTKVSKVTVVVFIVVMSILIWAIYDYCEMVKRTGHLSIDMSVVNQSGSEVEGARNYYERRGR